MTSSPRSTAWRAVESQHMWVMKPPITSRRTPNWLSTSLSSVS